MFPKYEGDWSNAEGVDEVEAAVAAAAAITRELTYWYGNKENPSSGADMFCNVE
jgi:hypothetical protein